MKKVFSIFLVLLMLLGCSSGSSETKDNSSSNNQTEKKEETNNKKKQEEVSINEVVLLNEMDVVITAKSIENSLFGTDIKVIIENNSDKDLTVQIRDSSVNGYMIDTLFSCDVASGKKANDGITFLRTELETTGITDVADCEFAFHIFDDNWDTYLDSDYVQIKTSLANNYNYIFDDSGKEIYDENGIKVVYKGISEDSILGTGLILYISNESNNNICVQLRDVSINGYMIDPVYSQEVVSGKHAISDATFLSTYLEENGIDKIEEVEMSLYIFDYDSWNTLVEYSPIIINP